MVKEMARKMNKKSLSEQAATFADELKMKCPRVNLVGELFNEIEGAVGKRCRRSSVMHETGLMEQVVKLALV